MILAALEHYADCGRVSQGEMLESLSDVVHNAIAHSIVDADWLTDMRPLADGDAAKELAYSIKVGAVCP